jgi:hypothetical protein
MVRYIYNKEDFNIIIYDLNFLKMNQKSHD